MQETIKNDGKNRFKNQNTFMIYIYIFEQKQSYNENRIPDINFNKNIYLYIIRNNKIYKRDQS